ncbi:MAG: glycerol kinase GlpK [Clostridiaceae bacterium]|nr:glycerol kinase GlpK [Clostridiaceae bacterium]
MKQNYIIGIDQSTQGTKAMLFDGNGILLCRADKNHAQLVDERGWVEHNPEEIYQNTLLVVKELMKKSGVDTSAVACVGISNQRETAMAWNRSTGKPVYNAIVWQCARGEEICKRITRLNPGAGEEVRRRTGLRLSPYFSAAKLAWILEHVKEAASLAARGELCCGTMDSYLVYRLTKGREFRTDYSNASRTQLFHIRELAWDETLCGIFEIPSACLPDVTDSDGFFGMTDFEGILPGEVPIHGVMGDSHGALFGQGCLSKGMMKTTYGTGSSIMMNIGEAPIFSDLGIVTSLAWKTGGRVQYVLEGNINYTGAVITWLKDQLGLLASAGESEELAKRANPADHTYLVPAFSGLGAPYWRSDVSAAFISMSRTTGRAELVKAGLCSIAYQIADIVELMKEASGIHEVELRVDGGPTKNSFLMQFQSDILNSRIRVPEVEELSGLGAAYAAGLGAGIYDESLFGNLKSREYIPAMGPEEREEKLKGWTAAVKMVLASGEGDQSCWRS